MKAGILRRVERMEQKINPGDDDTAWFVEVVSPFAIGRPVSGWFFGTGSDKVEVWRQEGETDEDLQKRAETLARQHAGGGGIPFLISLTDQAPERLKTQLIEHGGGL